MKTKELIDLLQKIDPSGDKEVVIPLSRGIGGPAMTITGVSSGFDWYGGKILLGIKEGIVSLSQYDYLIDQVKNHDFLMNCRVNNGAIKICVANRKHPKIGQTLEIRACGEKNGKKCDKKKVKVLSQEETLLGKTFVVEEIS